MTTLAITPSWKNKTAKFKGTVAAGEHVSVTIQNNDGEGGEFIDDASTLRLRVVNPCNGRTLAVFPEPVPEGETPETWDADLSPLRCTLNLNTVQMLKAVPPAANVPLIFVLDDYDNKTLYFKEQFPVEHWPRLRGEEEPTDLDNYKDLIAEFNTRLDGYDTRITAAENVANAATENASAAAATASQAIGVANQAVDKAEIAQNSAAASAEAAHDSALAAAAAQEAAESAAESINSPDATLAEEGVAADAKATGERIAAEKNRAEAAEAAEETRAKAAESALAANVSSVQKAISDEAELRAAADADLEANKADKSAVAAISSDVAAAQTAISNLSASKADKATTYTKTEVDAKIAGVQTFKKYLVQTLPDADEADMKGLYLVPTGETSEEGDLCEEWTVVEENGEKRWERIGGTTVDLNNYYTKSEAEDNFVAKEAGKGLSTNDYTTAEKEKLAGVEAGAQVNAPADSALSNTSENAVQNKVVKVELDKKYEKPSTGIPASDLADGEQYHFYDAQVDYVVFGGSQYVLIPTITIGTAKIGFELGATYERNGDNQLLGIMFNSMTLFQLLPSYNTDQILDIPKTSGNYKRIISSSPTMSTFHEWKYKNGTFTVDDTTVATYDNQDFAFPTNGNLGVFARCSSDGVTVSGIQKGRFYYLKIYNGDTLLYDIVPVRVGTAGCLYDRVSKRLFHPSGGTLSCGADVATTPMAGKADKSEVPTKPEDIGAQPAGSYATAEQGEKADAALSRAEAEAGFTEWTILRNGVDVTAQVEQPYWQDDPDVVYFDEWVISGTYVQGDHGEYTLPSEPRDAVALSWYGVSDGNIRHSYTATRTRLPTMADVDAVKGNIPYTIGAPIVIDTASSEVVEGETVYYGAATLANRTANVVQVTAATALDELRITFPAATSGKVRDFGLRVEIGTGSAALAAPALVPIAPTGETIKIENSAAEIPALADGTATAKGVTLLYFSETAPGVFVVKGEQVEEVA